MADVTVTITNTTPREARGLQFVMDEENTRRTGVNDSRTAKHDNEVARITAENERRAAEEPPLDALPIPDAPALETIFADGDEYVQFIVTERLIPSYSQEEGVQSRRSDNMDRLFERATPQQRRAAIDALRGR